MLNYQGKWVLITGASSGIGECYAEEFAKKGANVILVARNHAKLTEIAGKLQKQYGIQAEVLAIDLSAINSPQTLYDQVNSLNHPIHILVNNAGIGTFGPFHTSDVKKTEQEIFLNVYALTALTRLFLPAMVAAKEGVIINVASTAGFQPLPYMAVYGATKAFVLSFTEALWAEYHQQGIHILAVCPGPVATSFFDAMGTSIESLGKKDTPITIVNATFRALEKNQMYVIPGAIKNYFLAQSVRFLPRKLAALISEKIMRK